MATLIEQRNEVNTKLDTLLAKESLSAEDRTAHDQLAADFDRLSGEIVAADKLAAEDTQRRQLHAARAAEMNKGRGRRTEPTTSSLSTTTTTAIGNPREAFEEDPKKGFKSPREFMLSVIQAGQRATTGGKIDDRLHFLTAGSDEGRTISDPAGGFLVPVGFSPQLLQIDPEDDPMGAFTRKIPMSYPTVKIPARTDKNHTTSVSGGLTVTRKPETVPATASQMTLEQVVLEAHDLFGFSYATESLLTDSPISFAAILEAGFSEQFTFQLISERLNGSGVGEFLGVNKSPALIAVAKQSGQAPKTLIYENIVAMRARVWGYGNALWIANHDTLPQLLLMNQAVGAGGSAMIWQPSARDNEPDRLLGRPIVFSEYPNTLGTQGDILCVNWSEYLEGMFQPLQSAESIHVRFINHERAFKFWLRNAGQPWWRTALTVNQGANSLSPYVVLASR